MIFETVASGGCRSYLIGCGETHAAAVIDPEESRIDHYMALAGRHGLAIRYVIDTHTHADHFSGTKEMAEKLGVPAVASRDNPAPYVNLRLDDGDMLVVGKLRLQAMMTPGHTRDSMCLVAEDRVFTGDTLLIGGTGRSDLPTGDPDRLFDSLFGKLLRLPPALLVYPAHEYKDRGHSTIGDEIAANPRLQKRERAEFVKMMDELNLAAPTHLTEALRTNLTGGKTVSQLLAEAAAGTPFMSLSELHVRLSDGDVMVLDVREADAFAAGHIPGARSIPRGQLELRVNTELPDPMVRIVCACDVGKISTLAAHTLRQLGFTRAAALDGGIAAWREGGFPLEM